MTVYIGGKRVGPSEPDPDAKRIQDWIDRISDEGRNLTAWEVDFLRSIADQWDRSGSLTDKQVRILERIYTEKVP